MGFLNIIFRGKIVYLFLSCACLNLNASEEFNEKDFYKKKYHAKKLNQLHKQQEHNVKSNKVQEFRKMLRKEIEIGNQDALCNLIQKFINPKKLPPEEFEFRNLYSDELIKVKFLKMLSISDFAKNNTFTKPLIKKLTSFVNGLSDEIKSEVQEIIEQLIPQE